METIITNIQAVVDVVAERERQDTLWGIQNHAPQQWLHVLVEEVGEVAKAINDSHFGGEPWTEYRTEMVQVAAVALAAIESYDRNEGAHEAAHLLVTTNKGEAT